MNGAAKLPSAISAPPSSPHGLTGNCATSARMDVLEVINAEKAQGTADGPRPAGHIRRFFNWCIDQHTYGLTVSPCDRLKVEKIIGPSQSRSRRLSDAELFALWRVTGRMKHPVGSLYRMLLLTGLRLNEAAHLSWPEVHDDSIVIPAARMKGTQRHGA